MNNLEFQLRGVGDPRLAIHAASALPAWLWSVDGTRILWANPVGARLFSAANAAALAQKTFGPADSQRRQVAQLAGRLPASGAIRLERLRGFGASPGMLVTCGCARLTFADGSHGILVAAADPVGRAMPLVERLQRLVEGIDSPIAVFARDGLFIGASNAARSLLGFHDLSEPGLAQARHDALRQGRVELPIGIGHLVLQRVGTGADIGLVALIATGALPKAPSPAVPHVAPPASSDARATCDGLATSNDAPAASSDAPVIPPAEAAPDYEQPALSNEAPAEFALFDEFAAQPAAAVADERSEPDLQSVLQLDVPHLEATPDQQQQPAEPSAAEVEHQPLPSPLSLYEPQRQESQFEEAQHQAPSPQESLQQPLPQESLPPEPSPYVEAVADEPSAAPLTSLPLAPPAHDDAPSASAAPSWRDEPLPVTRKHPLRFTWQMDADGRFLIRSDEFTQLIGAHTAAGFGRLWREIAETFELDPAGRVSAAVATRDTWSGITLDWPVDGGGRLPVELSGLPIFDRDHQFAGYRGFGVCRDLDALARLAALRRYELLSAAPAPQALSAGIVSAAAVSAERVSADHDSVDHASTSPSGQDPNAEGNGDLSVSPQPSTPAAGEISQQADLETSVESFHQPDEMARVSPLNVVPFRSNGESKSPVLSPVENSAFNELARQLAERLERENVAPPPASMPEAPPDVQPLHEASAEPPAIAETSAAGAQPDWLSQPEPPARGESRRDRTLLDLLPMGVLIYRLDRLLYANTAFLARMGYPSLQALEEAGGLDALYVEPGVSSTSSTSDTGTPVRISAGEAATEATTPSVTDARLHTISWDGDSALALIFAGAPALEDGTAPPTDAVAEPVALAEPSAVGHANAEELGAILDTTAEGILMFDAEGNVNSCNRSAEALFGRDGGELVQLNLADLFAPESRPEVRDYLETIKGADIASLLEHGRDVLAQVRSGGLIPVSMTIGRTQAHGPNFFAVFRDQSQSRKSQNELREAQRLMNRAGNAKSDMLARISHEIRTPLNAIIGFADVMIGERFGALGNERYVEYMKDIRASGERVIAIINDLLDLSRIETGKLDLAFADQNLNDLVEQCVSGMQSQANRERIIIRTSLAHALPPVIADARALRQITLNLIGNSIHLANAGGQVIVSTALSDSGEVVLRVRDTGHGLNDNEVAAAMEPFRTPPPSDQASDSSGVSLSLTRALVEANRARFQIKTGGRSGTLIEVVFPHAMART